MATRDHERSGIGMTSQRTRSRLVSRLREQGIRHIGLLEIIDSTPRHLFIDEALAHRAYEDTSLPIGFNQTISQPYIVARMIELMLSAPGQGRVLEIGTGSGYQTALLASLYDQVYTVERIRPLQERARQRLRDLGYRNIHYRYRDGEEGWADQGPYDGIVVCAAAPDLPRELVGQLSPGGVMAFPLVIDGSQHLCTVTGPNVEGRIEVLEPVSFVPLLSGRIDR